MDALRTILQGDLLPVILVFIAAASLVGLVGLVVFSKTNANNADADSPRTDFSDSNRWEDEWEELLAENERAAMAKILIPKGNKERKKLGERLVQAGLYHRNAVIVFVAAKAICFGVAILLGFAASSAGLMTTQQGLIAGAAAGLFGTIAPSFWLDYKKNQRQTKLRRAMPDALDVIIICVEAGLSLPAAFQKVAEELRTAHPLLAAEFAIAQKEMQMGCSTGEALQRLAARFDLEEMRSLAAVVVQTEKFGASVVRALRVHAESLRIKRLQSAEERAQKAIVKILFPTVLFIFPALFVVIIGPAVFDIAAAFEKF